MAIDRIGNSLRRATDIEVSNAPVVLQERVGKSDRRDVYRFRVGAASNFRFNLKGTQNNTRLKLLNSAGQKIQAARGARAKVRQFLEAGTYFLQVSSNGDRTSRYRLTVARPAASPLPPTAFNIRFDYRYDTRGWFTPERRSALEAAGRVWENIIVNDLPDVPAGTSVAALSNPEAGDLIRNFADGAAIDDLVIFVGARELGGSTLGITTMPVPFRDQTRLTGNSFQPWLGTIAFDTSTNWFFDPTPNTADDIPAQSSDFISTAVHEMAHVLGFGTSDASDDLIEGSAFRGGNAIAVNGGQPIPMSGLAHIRDDYQFGGLGIPLMSPFASFGKRKLPTRLDVAILDDIGYTINYGATFQNPTV
jgi:hypothetical protein